MKQLLILVTAIVFPAVGWSQQNANDAPATAEDVQRYFQVVHAREMTKQMLDAVTRQIRQMTHEQVLKNGANVPPDCEERVNRMTDEMLRNFPVDEIIKATIPVYQKHWTKGDIEALIAFYSTPTGQKVLTELPATIAEAMQASAPIIQKQMDQVRDRVKLQIVQLTKDPKSKSSQPPQSSPN